MVVTVPGPNIARAGRASLLPVLPDSFWCGVSMRFSCVLLAGFLCLANPATATAPVLGEPTAPVAGVVLGGVVRTKDADELRFYVQRALADRYVTQKGITVSRAEIDRYERDVDAFMKADAKKRGVAPADAGTALSAEDKAARDEIAAAFIRQWKINRALYQQYGGRVIFQQGGPEPLDAWLKFLEAARARGDFVIVDKALEAGFWQYYRDDARHSFIPAPAKAFSVPPWAGR